MNQSIETFGSQNPRISGATFQDIFQVKGIIFRSFPAPETIDSVWPICRKNSKTVASFSPHSPAKTSEFQGPLSKIFSKSKASFSGPSMLQKPLIQCGLSAEKNSKTVASFSPHSAAKKPEYLYPSNRKTVAVFLSATFSSLYLCFVFI